MLMDYEGVLKTNDKGVMYIYNKEFFNQFFKENPSSEFTFTASKISQNKSNRLTAYYFVEVIPKCIQGFRDIGENHNKGSIMEELKRYSPVMWHFEMVDDVLTAIARDFNELNYFEKKRHIDEIIIFAANDLSTEIENLN